MITVELLQSMLGNSKPNSYLLRSQEKRHWRRYIYLWINYALYEELEARDVDRTRQVYQACLEMMPHKKFTFAKIWLMFAHFEVRQKNLVQARKILVNRNLLFSSVLNILVSDVSYDLIRLREMT